MVVRFDNMQMLFGKINNGSPFGVIRGFYDYFPNNPNNSPQLRQFLNNKCHFIGFVEIFIEPSESLFFVYENDPSTTFNLKNFLLVLAKYTYSEKICYCENKQDKNTHNMKSIEFLSTGRHDFGKDLDSINVELSNPNTFIQSLFLLGSFLHGKTIESFDNPKNYPPNIKINEIANDLESGKIVGEKIISDALLSVVSCCFMDDKNLKDLKKVTITSSNKSIKCDYNDH
ncbi:hypothetical protein VN0664_12550 [Helicobacter pylori]|nr:hypothetical protein VN0664_12550 [Helicobacter pylori]